MGAVYYCWSEKRYELTRGRVGRITHLQGLHARKPKGVTACGTATDETWHFALGEGDPATFPDCGSCQRVMGRAADQKERARR